jgi:hypothetical protein
MAICRENETSIRARIADKQIGFSTLHSAQC